MRRENLGPETDDGHNGGTTVDGEEEGSLTGPVVSAEDGTAVHLESDQLYVGIVEKDTSGKRVENTLNEERLVTVRLEGLADSNTDGNTNRRGEGIKARSQEFLPRVEALDLSYTDSKSDTFEKLMENDGDQQTLELIRSDSKRKTNDNRVEKTRLRKNKRSVLGSSR